MINLAKHYHTLTASERLQLSIDAMARQDYEELAKLGETCPRYTYQSQREIAYTSKYLNLQSMALLHAAYFWQYRGTMLLAYTLHLFAPTRERLADYKHRRADLLALIEAWRRVCNYAGFDPDSVTLAFGLELESKLDDFPNFDTEPDETMIDTLYQGHLRNWQS
jgi:hypothetical protein